jgi:hypothetical protein
MAWDASAILTGDPDQPGELFLRLMVDPDFPLPLAIVECAANLEIRITVKKLDSENPNYNCFELGFFGKCLDLSEMDMRMTEWQGRYRVPNKSQEDLNRERAAHTPLF